MLNMLLGTILAAALALPSLGSSSQTAADLPTLPPSGTLLAAAPSNPRQVDTPAAAPASDDEEQLIKHVVALPNAGVSNQLLEATVDALTELNPQITLVALPSRRAPLLNVAVPDSSVNQVLQSLQQTNLFAVVDVDKILAAEYSSAPSDPLYTPASGDNPLGQWALQAWPGSNFSQAWPRLATFEPPQSAPIAVIDSGCVLNHPDRGSNIVAGWDFVDDDADVTPDGIYRNSAWHGSAVTSVIASSTDNSQGMAGATWDQPVICYRAGTGDGNFYMQTVALAVLDAVDQGAKVINLSLGGYEDSPLLKWVIEEAIDLGVVVVAAVGNNGEAAQVDRISDLNRPNYPATYPNVIAVGSITQAGQRASFSNYNPASQVSLVAPGVEIWGWGPRGSSPDCRPAQDYCRWKGTSFSAPLVSAAAGLILRARPGLSAAAVGNLLTASAVDSGPTGYDNEYGAGLLNVAQALDLAQAAATPAWFTPPHGGQATVMVGKDFSLPLGLGGSPSPYAVVADGKTLPSGMKLVQDAKLGWSLSGKIGKPGIYTANIMGIQSGRVFSSKTIRVEVAGYGAVSFSAKLSKTSIDITQKGVIKLTATGSSGSPAGTFQVKQGSKVLVSGDWAAGQRTIRLPLLKRGSHSLKLYLHQAAWPGGQAEAVNAQITLGKLTVTKIKPKFKLKRSGKRLTVTVTAAGAKAKGKVRISYGKAKPTERKSTAKLSKGKKTFTLPAGLVRLKVTFLGNTTTLKASTKTKRYRFN
ncbi:MAG: S8 family serine peptidase [Bifidobacteriaceae bacterium]|jgi:hypothetical protein|nr:S8 family serine peptidase [Bifidobacteriaceae bacterium]